MRRLLFAATLIAPFLLASMAPACSSKQAAQDQDGDAGDAGGGEDAPSVVLEDGDDLSADVGMGTGFPDVGIVDTGAISCATTSDCLVPGYVCGYAATGGCSATGSCVYAAPPTDPHGVTHAACGCGQDGSAAGGTVLYVSPGETSAPVSSASPCVDASAPLDAGGDAALDAGGDAGLDAAVDASDSGNASDAGDAGSPSAALGCTSSGGSVAAAECCPAAGSYPDTCNGPCNGGCSPATTVPALVCNCPEAECFSASAGRCIAD
jgi:hypothetical protein